MDSESGESKLYRKNSYQSIPLQDLPQHDELPETNEDPILSEFKTNRQKRLIAGLVLLCLATLFLAITALNPTQQLGTAGNIAPSVAPTKAPRTEYIPEPILPPTFSGETGYPSAAPTIFSPFLEDGILDDMKPTVQPIIESFASWVDRRLPTLQSFAPVPSHADSIDNILENEE